VVERIVVKLAVIMVVAKSHIEERKKRELVAKKLGRKRLVFGDFWTRFCFFSCHEIHPYL